jgi:hypothetical protein
MNMDTQLFTCLCLFKNYYQQPVNYALSCGIESLLR